MFGWLKEIFERLRKPAVADWPDTVGPALDEHPPVPPDVREGSFKGWFYDGWWSLARRTPAHPKRLGRAIKPQAVVVHTTDMAPGTFKALVKSWTTKKGAGNCAHFLIGKTKEDGVVQFAPIYVNANHAGGPNPGGFKLLSGSLVHPNTAAVGIELDNAGKLDKDLHIHPETRLIIDNVFVDSKGGAWEAMTPYQKEMLGWLLKDLKAVLQPWPEGTKPQPNDKYAKHGVPWAATDSPIYVGHVTLNPIRKTDPGPEVMEFIRGLK